MTKFKVGDKVRVVYVGGIEFGENHYYDGFETEVAYISCDGDVNLLNTEGEIGVLIDSVELKKGVIELIEPKPTKKQRITALEKTVASLTEQLQALQQQVNERFEPSTVVVAADDDTASLAKAIEETSIKTANELRAEVIEKAKMFVESAIERGYDSNTPKGDAGNETYKSHFYTIEFFTKENEVVALVTRTGKYGLNIKSQPDHVARAKCMSGDVFNEHIGKAIALGRALGLDVSEFENAVQPTDFVVGHCIYWNFGDYEDVFEVYEIKGSRLYGKDGLWVRGRESTIINDTNAQYGGVE